MKVTFTGHRPDKTKDPKTIKNRLLKCLLSKLGKLEDHHYVLGGAPGFDTIALEVLLENNVPKENITIAVPFRGFEKMAGFKHPKENMEAYTLNYTCGVLVKEVGGKEGTFAKKCFTRNIYLVQNGDIIFTNWDGSTGGTANTVKLATKKGIPIVNVGDKE
jgi:predicted Rossmann fold nucleotide-binding protein DprA/Smf involved in DNA uptake